MQAQQRLADDERQDRARFRLWQSRVVSLAGLAPSLPILTAESGGSGTLALTLNRTRNSEVRDSSLEGLSQEQVTSFCGAANRESRMCLTRDSRLRDVKHNSEVTV